jgi:hypothetical protein
MSIIGLNIGGHIFKTTKSTICSSTEPSFFSKLISEGIPSIKDDADNYFIDRDGQYFAPILEFLRTGQLCIPKKLDPLW